MTNNNTIKLGKGNIISIQSHVAFGHAGNASAVFPMQRMGYNVTAINTVLFSNHTGYGKWRGTVVQPSVVADILTGIDERGVYTISDALVTGYMGSIELGDIIMNSVDTLRRQNPNALYVCDPVFGDVGRGIFVTEGIPEYFRDVALPKCDICTPNLFELEWLTNSKITTVHDAIAQAHTVIDRGAKIVLVTSLEHDATLNNTIEVLAVTKECAWSVVTPKLDMEIAPNGSGDATTALFCVNYLETGDIAQSLSNTVSAIYEIFKNTKLANTRELQLVASGDGIVSPSEIFNARKIV